MLFAKRFSIRRRPLVFKRWSRKGYAQFISLHREVVIGVIKASICYASMLKMHVLMNDDHCPEAIRRNDNDEDDDGPGGGGHAWSVVCGPAAGARALTVSAAGCVCRDGGVVPVNSLRGVTFI